MHFGDKDEYLEDRINQYDNWIQDGKVPTSSKVIPISESLSGLQWVLPTQQAIEILRNSRTFALVSCDCRTRYNRCDNPREVCILINDVADKEVARGRGCYIDLEEAKNRLKLAHEHGLVHLTIYNPEQHIFALCSCCECCCHDLQFLKKYHRPDLIAHADYIAEVDASTCIHCGTCVKRCVFGAQEINEKLVVFHQDKCYGCGLCTTTCPTGAIRMKLRVQRTSNKRSKR